METHGLRLALVEAPTGIVHGMWAAHSEPQVIGPFPPSQSHGGAISGTCGTGLAP
jgi:hypothetical protein